MPTSKLVRYHLNLKRVIMRKLFMGIADGTVEVDGKSSTQQKICV
jgi:3-hydroxyacyl-[acyl-carrier protein] dehydratase/trans-2-decenoyl-[acyl-carrier protein] isomerase